MISLIIDNPSDTNQRIDKFLKKYLPNAPLSGIYKWIRTGKIKVNRKRVDQIYRIQGGDTINLYFESTELEEMIGKRDKEVSRMHGERKNAQHDEASKIHKDIFSVLYEDEYLMIINKPPGMNVHPGEYKSTETSLIEHIRDSLGEKHDSLTWKPSLVHRIDRDTSGAILIAKEKIILESLLGFLREHKIEKVYHAIVIRTPSQSRDTIDKKLSKKEENSQNEKKVRIDPDGQRAITHYTVLRTNIYDKYSLLECRIETGRTHQIRVHLASIGCPILGDKMYGNSGENSYARRKYGIQRQMLHARLLSFIHPVYNKKITVEAPYMEDMKEILA